MRICLIESKTGKQLSKFPGNTNGVVSLAFHPARAELAAGGMSWTDSKLTEAEGDVRVYALGQSHEGVLVHRYGAGGYCTKVIYSPDGLLLASRHTGTAGRVDRLPSKQPSDQVQLRGASGRQFIAAISLRSAEEILFSHDSRLLLIVSDRVLRAFRTTDGAECALPLKIDNGRIRTVLRDSRGNLYIVKTDGQVDVWDPASAEQTSTFNIGQTNTLAIHPDGRRLVASVKGGIEVRDTLDGRLVLILSFPSRLPAVVFSPNKMDLIATGDDRSVRIWRGIDRLPEKPSPKKAAQLTAEPESWQHSRDHSRGWSALGQKDAAHADRAKTAEPSRTGPDVPRKDRAGGADSASKPPATPRRNPPTPITADVLARFISPKEFGAITAAKQAGRRLENGDFHDGLTGWNAEDAGGAFRVFRGGDKMMITSYGSKQDASQGRIYQCFAVPDVPAELKFFVHGGQDPQALYVALWARERLIHRVTGKNSNEPFEARWGLSGLKGQVVTLEIRDEKAGAWGFIGAHGFEVLETKKGK
jgi:hypothetical protein